MCYHFEFTWMVSLLLALNWFHVRSIHCLHIHTQFGSFPGQKSWYSLWKRAHSVGSRTGPVGFFFGLIALVLTVQFRRKIGPLGLLTRPDLDAIVDTMASLMSCFLPEHQWIDVISWCSFLVEKPCWIATLWSAKCNVIDMQKAALMGQQAA